jgi:3'(2'), 5'-bisphosphate nucleotidase
LGRGAERLTLAPGAPTGAASERTAIRGRPRPARGLIALRSRFHHAPETDVFLDRLPDVQRAIVGSSVKFCRLAEGEADLYARMSPMSEWDIAAGHAVLSAAGGVMTMTDGKPLLYGRPGFKVPGFIAWADGAAAA